MADASTFFPGQLFQNPDGSFSLNVTGQLHAQGLNLDSSTSVTPPDIDRIRWLRTGDGAVVADINTVQSAPGATSLIQVEADSPDNNPTQVSLSAVGGTGHQSAELKVLGGNAPGGSNRVTVAMGAQLAIVLDDLARSHFLKGGALLNSAVLATTLTWPGASTLSGTQTVAVPGASAGCNGVASPLGFVSGTLEIPRISIAGNGPGTLGITGQTTTTPAANSTVTVVFIGWGT